MRINGWFSGLRRMVVAVVVSVLWLVSGLPSSAQALSSADSSRFFPAGGAAGTGRIRPNISDGERAKVGDRLRQDAAERNERIRVLAVKPSVDTEKEGGTDLSVKATSILFNYSTNRAERVQINSASGALLSRVTLAGVPQSSPEERSQAEQILWAQPELARLMRQESAVVIGGFVVSPPDGWPPDHRYVQMKVLSSDRRQLLRFVTVDMTSNAVANTFQRF